MATSGVRTRSGLERDPSLDVMRALALLGIIVLNYHGYLNGARAIGAMHDNWFVRIMDAWNGVLAPSPVIFVMVAGISCALLTSTTSTTPEGGTDFDRWVLIRRGVFLFTIGTMFEWVWRGTILPYFGVYFVFAAFIFRWSRRNITLLAAACTLTAAGIAWWRFVREQNGNFTGWMNPFEPNTPRNLLLRTFVDYTHPVFPWFAFFCVGLVIGRSYGQFRVARTKLIAPCVVALVVIYGISNAVQKNTDGLWQTLTSTDPFDRGILATAGVTVSSVLVIALVSLATERFLDSPVIDVLGRAGQLSLSLYLAHGFVFNAVVHWWGWVTPTGLDAALALSFVVWVMLVGFGAWWQRFFGRGPIERVYRSFGG